MDPARTILAEAIADRGESLGGLSRMLGRNAAYLQQYLARGTPRRLAEEDRRRLARYLGLAEEALGGAPAALPLVAVPRIDAGAAAGAGASNPDDPVVAVAQFEAGTLRALGVKGGALSLVEARGTSMEPLIRDGDRIMVDAADRRVTERGGIFVLRLDGDVVVKRARRLRGVLSLSSDNPDTPPIDPDLAARAEVLGRVVWLARPVA